MAKRSPILGYNHNVRYRGLIFHIQTEDSGLLSPHIFTHMFHGGVIISSRKLVYDSGSAEEAIKALMQSQHKAVLKALKKGTFDDKIDQYLVETPGLLPRGSTDPGGDSGRDSEPVQAPPSIRAETELDLLSQELNEVTGETHPLPVFPPDRPSVPSVRNPPPVPPAQSATAALRAKTPSRGSMPSQSRGSTNDEAAHTIRTVVPSRLDTAPEISIELNLDADDDPILLHTRTSRDTDIEMPIASELRGATISDGVPGSMADGANKTDTASRGQGGSVPPRPERRTGDRGSAVGAASLPPARPIKRPPTRPAFTPPAVISRPLASDDRRSARESDAVEVYAPAPPSVEAPPGAERPGQYAYKRGSQTIPIDLIKGERSRTGSVPPGTARPKRTTATPSVAVPRQIMKELTPSAGPLPVATGRVAEPARPLPQGPRPADRPRTPTPARTSPSGPAVSRTGTNNSSVVMTRPAVIVGAPPKAAAPPRVRKAREEEGRGFGQGLISEKSLDEVILAYLSEDTEDK